MKGGESLKLRDKFKISFKMAVDGWKGKTYNFRNWFGKTFWGIDNSKLANNETIYSIITRLSNTLSSLSLRLYDGYDVTNNQASDLLTRNPNDNMHSFDFINKMEVSRNEKGNAYAAIMRDVRMQPTDLVPIDPAYVMPFINSDDDNLWYEVTGAGGTYYFHNMNILHVKHITGSPRWLGISPLDVLKNTLQYDKAIQEFSLEQMQKKESFKLTYGTNIDPEKKKQVVENFRQFYQENGGILFQEPGVEINEIERKQIASDLLKSEKITRTRVANVFNVPVSFLNDSEGQSYSSNEQLMIQFVQMCLTPIVKQYESEFDRKLLTETEKKRGYRFKFDLNELLQGDMAARTAYYKFAVRSAILTPDDIRKKEGEKPRGGKADELWLSGDLYPIDLPAEQRKSGSYSDKGGDED